MPAAHRLRVELALVAIGTGQTDRARALLAPVMVSRRRAAAAGRRPDRDGPVRGGGRAREVLSELRNARAAWSEVDGADANLGLAAIELVAAAAHRRAGRPDASAAAATAGLTRLRGRPGARVARNAVHVPGGGPHHRVDLGAARHGPAR